MKYDHCPVPTSLVRSSSSRIATYETCVFIDHSAPWGGEVGSAGRGLGRGKTVLLTCITAALVIAAFFLGIAAAQADPANTANQATILRFTNRVELGAVRPVKINAQVDSALAHLSAIHPRYEFRARPKFSEDMTEPEVLRTHTTYMNISKITLAGVLLTLASPVGALAQSAPQNAAATESAALGSLSPRDRAQVQNLLALLSTGQIDASTAVVQIDAVLSDSEVNSVLAEAKKTNSDAADAGQFLVNLANLTSK